MFNKFIESGVEYSGEGKFFEICSLEDYASLLRLAVNHAIECNHLYDPYDLW